MKIIKAIRIPTDYKNLVAFVTTGKKPTVIICYDDVFNEEHGYESSIKSCMDIDDTRQIDEYLVQLPLSGMQKIVEALKQV